MPSAIDAEAATSEGTAREQEASGKKLRALHVPIPEETYWHLRAMALQSRLPFKVYMAQFCADAWPYSPKNADGPKVKKA